MDNIPIMPIMVMSSLVLEIVLISLLIYLIWMIKKLTSYFEISRPNNFGKQEKYTIKNWFNSLQIISQNIHTELQQLQQIVANDDEKLKISQQIHNNKSELKNQLDGLLKIGDRSAVIEAVARLNSIQEDISKLISDEKYKNNFLLTINDHSNDDKAQNTDADRFKQFLKAETI